MAAALLTVELIAGMQMYVLNTVVPIVGGDLHAREYYGVITGAFQITMFLTLPLGPYLVQRFRIDRVLLCLTWLSIVGGVLTAVAPSVIVFALGRAVSGLAAGALSTVSLSAIVTVLPATWRRMTLAGYNVVWVAASLIGPIYAGWVAAMLSWRWALVVYLPLLVLARAVIARELAGSRQDDGARERLPLVTALVLAGGVALLSLVGLQRLSSVVAVTVGGVGLIVIMLAGRRLLPDGTMRLGIGRPAAVATMGLVTGAYFGASGIVAIVVHDVVGGTSGEVAYVLAAGGLAWALTGLMVSRFPAQLARTYIRRSYLGSGLLSVGLSAMTIGVLSDGMGTRIGGIAVGWTIAGVGMGLVYLDTLNHIVDVPMEVDGISVAQAAGAAVLVEAITTATMATLATAVVGRSVEGGEGQTASVFVLAFTVVVAAGVAVSARRVATNPA